MFRNMLESDSDTGLCKMSKRNRRRFFGTDSPSVMSPVNKRLNFEVNDEDDEEVLLELNQFDLELESADLALDEDILKPDKFSPCRTRSGLVYESGLKKHRFRLASKQRKKKLRSRNHSGQSGTGSLADCSENESETSNSEYTEDIVKPMPVAMDSNDNPPPLNYQKAPISKFSQVRERPDNNDIPSSPISSYMVDDRMSPIKESSYGKWPREPRNMFLGSPLNSPSPPSHTMKAMRLFEGLPSPNSACAISSPQSAPRIFNLKSRLLFDVDGEPRRFSYPGINHPLARQNLPECDSTSSAEKPKSANINPFTPEGMMAVNKKRSRSQSSINS